MAKENKKEQKAEEMSAAEARKLRAAQHKPAKRSLSDEEKKEAFRLFWAQQKYKYGKSKNLEEILWLHLKAVKMDEPEKFEDGIAHFGLKKLSK